MRLLDRYIYLIILFVFRVKGNDWRVHRKLLNPSFSYNVTNKFVPIFNKHLRNMCKLLDAKCGQPAFDILLILKTIAMDMICGKCGKYVCNFCFYKIEIDSVSLKNIRNVGLCQSNYLLSYV